MMYRVAYSHIANAGDLLNIYIMERVFGVEITHAGYLSSDLVGIGSCLGELQYSKKLPRRIKQRFLGQRNQYVWGTGFMNFEEEHELPFYNKHLTFSAVRGKLTKERVESLTNRSLGEIPLCDGGILTSYLFADERIEKKYELGIIPHYKEQECPAFGKLLSISENATVIDLKSNPMDVYRDIASCEYVLSSSLHGLIISDSFGIPNLHVKATSNMMGDGFKFMDYYSGYELDDCPFDINLHSPSINDIIDRYKVSPEVVEKKKKEMIECFPFKN